MDFAYPYAALATGLAILIYTWTGAIIGPARKKALLLHFGTARAIRGASLEDLKKAPGVSAGVAQAVHDFYNPGG